MYLDVSGTLLTFKTALSCLFFKVLKTDHMTFGVRGDENKEKSWARAGAGPGQHSDFLSPESHPALSGVLSLETTSRTHNADKCNMNILFALDLETEEVDRAP